MPQGTTSRRSVVLNALMALPYLTGLTSHVGIPYYTPPPMALGTMSTLPVPDQGNEPPTGYSSNDGARPRKRKRPPTLIQLEDTSLSESDEEVDMDPDHYYQSTPRKMPKVVDKFMAKTFSEVYPQENQTRIGQAVPKAQL